MGHMLVGEDHDVFSARLEAFLSSLDADATAVSQSPSPGEG
jgi:hypothetical protein